MFLAPFWTCGTVSQSAEVQAALCPLTCYSSCRLDPNFVWLMTDHAVKASIGSLITSEARLTLLHILSTKSNRHVPCCECTTQEAQCATQHNSYVQPCTHSSFCTLPRACWTMRMALAVLQELRHATQPYGSAMHAAQVKPCDCACGQNPDAVEHNETQQGEKRGTDVMTRCCHHLLAV